MLMRRNLYGHFYYPNFMSVVDRQTILDWIKTLKPIWESRYSKNNPPPEGETNRMLLRPVYWLGNWQFACLGYYHPVHRKKNCAVVAEKYPAVLQRLVSKIEEMVRQRFKAVDIPEGWTLNTCLVNFYGSQQIDGKKVDTARVGEHKDFEPGPVASLSLGERALIQFVESQKKGTRTGVVLEQWLDDRSLEIFGGTYFKSKVFHRVQRVDKKTGNVFETDIQDFETRRINFTFRFVPESDWVAFSKLPQGLREDVTPYVLELAKKSAFFKSLV